MDRDIFRACLASFLVGLIVGAFLLVSIDGGIYNDEKIKPVLHIKLEDNVSDTTYFYPYPK